MKISNNVLILRIKRGSVERFISLALHLDFNLYHQLQIRANKRTYCFGSRERSVKNKFEVPGNQTEYYWSSYCYIRQIFKKVLAKTKHMLNKICSIIVIEKNRFEFVMNLLFCKLKWYWSPFNTATLKNLTF